MSLNEAGHTTIAAYYEKCLFSFSFIFRAYLAHFVTVLLTHRVTDWQGYVENIIFYTKDQNENDNNNNEKEGNNRCPICSSFLKQERLANMYTEGLKPPTLHWQACNSRDDQQSARLSPPLPVLGRFLLCDVPSPVIL